MKIQSGILKTMKTNLELYRVVTVGYRWLQEPPRMIFRDTQTDRHFIIIYISSSSSLPGLLYIPLFKGPEVRSRNNSGTALQMPPNGLYISSTINYNDIRSTTNYNYISSTTNYLYISSTTNNNDTLHYRKVAKRWKEGNLNNYFTQKVQKRRRSKYPLH